MKAKSQWNKIPKIKTSLQVYIIVTSNNVVKYNANASMSEATTILQFTPTAVKMIENKAAVVVGTQALSKNENENKVCECEAKIRAFMRMLRVGEGTGEIMKSYNKKEKRTVYIPHDFEKGYTTAFGGNKIVNLNDHPRINYGGSTAAGAYQVMGYTWDDNTFKLKRKEYKISSFSKENQDKFAVVLMKYHPGCAELINLIISNQTEQAIRKCASRIWASLPEKGDNSRYLFKGKPQPVTPMKEVLEHYQLFLKEELSNKSPIYLEKGFLKEFGYDCCKNNPNSTTNKAGYDIEKAVNHINNNAEPKSISKCALYVRQAINAGGINNLSGHAYEYYDTDKLVKVGFKKIGTDIESIQLKKGDIAAFASVKGHTYGHLAMYNGIQWVSDFKQNSFWVANQYSIEKKYAIYRWE